MTPLTPKADRVASWQASSPTAHWGFLSVSFTALPDPGGENASPVPVTAPGTAQAPCAVTLN